MEPRSQPAVAGPILFFGLIIYTMFAPEVDLTTYANPADTVDVAAIATPQSVIITARPFSEYAPPRRAVLAPAQFRQSALPQQARFDDTALATTPLAAPLWSAPTQAGFSAAEGENDTIRFAPPALTNPLHKQVVRPLTPDLARPFTPGIHSWVRVTGSAVNLRIAPNASANVIGQFDADAQALKVAERATWSHIIFLTRDPVISGWMATQFLTPQAVP